MRGLGRKCLQIEVEYILDKRLFFGFGQLLRIDKDVASEGCTVGAVVECCIWYVIGCCYTLDAKFPMRLDCLEGEDNPAFL